ncbi:MAG TPA: ADP-ribosylglycohydrolase family protein, partial [Thermoplasmata archaeon]|nr:ADP-ribosylglycohydrolase family protein [Thermoplasmata archaeon]
MAGEKRTVRSDRSTGGTYRRDANVYIARCPWTSGNPMLLDRFSGALLGVAVGDMVGAPYEGMTRYEMWERHGKVSGPLIPMVTDDTEMTLAVARSVCRMGRVVPADLAAEFVRWFQLRPATVGRTTFIALQLLEEGVPWDEAGPRTAEMLGGHVTGNGPLMRCAPVALYAANDPHLLAVCSEDVTMLTHAGRTCVDATFALCTCLAAILLDGREEALASLDGRLVGRDRRVVRAVGRGVAGRFPGGRLPLVISTLQTAIAALATTSTFVDAVLLAVNRGGDTDTNGSVTGALAGAAYGRTA